MKFDAMKFAVLAGLASVLVACGGGGGEAPPSQVAYTDEKLTAFGVSYPKEGYTSYGVPDHVVVRYSPGQTEAGIAALDALGLKHLEKQLVGGEVFSLVEVPQDFQVSWIYALEDQAAIEISEPATQQLMDCRTDCSFGAESAGPGTPSRREVAYMGDVLRVRGFYYDRRPDDVLDLAQGVVPNQIAVNFNKGRLKEGLARLDALGLEHAEKRGVEGILSIVTTPPGFWLQWAMALDEELPVHRASPVSSTLMDLPDVDCSLDPCDDRMAANPASSHVEQRPAELRVYEYTYPKKSRSIPGYSDDQLAVFFKRGYATEGLARLKELGLPHSEKRTSSGVVFSLVKVPDDFRDSWMLALENQPEIIDADPADAYWLNCPSDACILSGDGGWFFGSGTASGSSPGPAVPARAAGGAARGPFPGA